MLLASASGLAMPLIAQIALDECIAPRDFTMLPWLALALVATSTISALCVRWKMLLMDITGRKMLASLRQDLFNHIEELGFDFFDTRSAGKIMVRVINDVNSLLFVHQQRGQLPDQCGDPVLYRGAYGVPERETGLSPSRCGAVVLFFVLKPYRTPGGGAGQNLSMNGYLTVSFRYAVTQAFAGAGKRENSQM